MSAIKLTYLKEVDGLIIEELGSITLTYETAPSTAPIQTISVNGVEQPIEAQNVDIEVPTKTSDLTNDSGFISEEADPTVPAWAKEPTKPTYTANDVGASPSNHNHSLANLTEKSYNSLTDKPNLTLLEDVLDIDIFAYNVDNYEPLNYPEYILYDIQNFIIYISIYSDILGGWFWQQIDFHWKIYVCKDADSDFYGKLFIYNGIELVVVPDSLVLGETSSTAFDGFRGLAAYDHSVTPGNPHGTTAEQVGASPIGHDHSGEVINPDAIVLDHSYTDLTMVDLPVGALFYNSDQLCWLLKTTTATYLNMGEELPMVCKNGDSTTHLEGQAVYISSGTGKFPVLKLTNSTIGKCNAIATQNIVNTGNRRGYYCFFGQARTFPYANVIKSTDNENTWVEGAGLYLCSENGKYSTTKEVAPAKSMLIGRITDRSGANISVMFSPETINAVSDLSDVDGAATTVASGDSFFLKVGNLWKTITESNFLSWFRGLSHTFTQLITFSGNLKTTKIIPISDTTGFVIRNAADSADVVKVDTSSTTNRAVFYVLGYNGSKIFEAYDDGGTANPNIDYIVTYPQNNSHRALIGTKNNGELLFSGSKFIVFNGGTNGGTLQFGTNGVGEIIVTNNILRILTGTGKIGIEINTPETKLDINGTTTFRDYTYFNNGTHTGDAVGDFREKTINGIKVTEVCTVANATTKGGGTWKRSTGISNLNGVMISLTNKTGSNSVKGTVVYASPTTDNAFTTNPVNGDMPFGIVYENGIANGSECWVVVSGIAEVLMENNEAATRSYVAYSSATTAGRIQVSATAPAAETHFREIGHTLESKTAGTNVLVKCVLHFN